METFIKVKIKSEYNLPKYGEGELLCQLKSGKIGYYPIGTIRCDYERVDWYLKPIEIPEITDEEIGEELNNTHTITLSDDGEYINQLTYWYSDDGKSAVRNFLRWYKEELKKRLK